MSRRSQDWIVFAGALAALFACAVASAQPEWVKDPTVQQRLARGEVVVETAGTGAADPGHPRGRVRAAVLVRARPEAIWSVMTDCAQIKSFVPGVRLCRRVDGATNGRWEDFEQEIRYSWYLPTVRYTFRADYDRPRRIDFHRISGDLKEEEGSWVLAPTVDGAATVVEYEVYLDPGFWIPHGLVIRALRKDLPAALSGLREHVESPKKAASE